jgi:metallo-beta-lactamase family protein
LLRFSNEHKLGKKICVEMCKIAKYLRTTEESKKLNSMKVPMVIISASGMAEGGRVLHHLKNYIQDHKNTILFSGFQAPDTRGDKILRGEKQIKIHGNFFDVNAEIINLSNSSAHADYEEILQWLQEFKAAPKKVFITHGNIESAISLKEKIIEKLNWNVEVPKYLQSEKL